MVTSEAEHVDTIAAAPVAAGGRRSRRWASVAVGASLLAGIVLAALRVEPQVWGDPGIWLSIGARLLDGDRLYADVFDNKDPLFFYSYAATLWIGGVRGPFALEVVWLGVGTVGMALALRALRVGQVAMVAGALIYPFALTAAWYGSGATMIPALALAPFALWFWARGSAFWAGVVVAIAMLFKLNLGLVVAAPLVALLALGVGGPRLRRGLEAAGGWVGALAVMALLLGLRGELVPYLHTIAYNFDYSRAGVHQGGVHAHLEIVRLLFAAAGKWQLPAAELALAVLLAVTLAGWIRLGRTFRTVSAVAVTTLAAAFVTLATTAIFVEHLQLLAYPVTLGAVALVVASRRVWTPLGAVTATLFVLFAMWSSLKHEDRAALTLRPWRATLLSTPGLALEGTRTRFYPSADHVAYAVFGRNSEDGHAAFIDGGMDLRCRYFVQYPFYRSDQLDETLDCARRKRPMLILVTTGFYDPMPGSPRWERFVADVRALLAARYQLVTEEGMSQVWKRR